MRKERGLFMVKAAIMGFGTVGSGVYEITANHNYEKKAGEDIEISKILDIRDFDEPKGLFTKEFSDILNDKSISVVAETMGGLHPAYEFTKELLASGKSVVTSNKELVATYGTELLKIARENNVNYLFEASVGGGIPIIRPMTSCLLANKLECVAGILNGTTNYILTQMFENEKSFDAALADAQKLGYAERNPAADVEGYDACRKIAILSSLAWGKFVDYKDIKTEGITNISSEDVKAAAELGYVIKLIGYADCDENDKVTAMVRPMLVKKSSPLASVRDVFNAVMVKGDALGEAMFYGKGAGKLATASAIVADIIDCVKHGGAKRHTMYWEESDKAFMKDSGDSAARFFVRCDSKLSEKIVETQNGLAAITKKMTEKELAKELEKLGGADKSVIRVLEI